MLAIDVGNSRIKWALFQANEIVKHGVFEYSSESFEDLMIRESLPIKNNQVMISHVAGAELKQRLASCLEANGCTAFFFAETQKEQCHIKNSYDKPSNMGVDRWLAAIAAYHHQLRSVGESVCIIDCGTAITLDVVSYTGVHMGGMIMPGYQTMVGSLVAKTSNIQDAVGLERDFPIDLQLASSTEKAIEAGCSQLMVNGLSGIINKLQKSMTSKLRCMVTGGDGVWISQMLDYGNTLEPFLVLQGLNYVAMQEEVLSNGVKQ